MNGEMERTDGGLAVIQTEYLLNKIRCITASVNLLDI